MYEDGLRALSIDRVSVADKRQRNDDEISGRLRIRLVICVNESDPSVKQKALGSRQMVDITVQNRQFSLRQQPQENQSRARKQSSPDDQHGIRALELRKKRTEGAFVPVQDDSL